LVLKYEEEDEAVLGSEDRTTAKLMPWWRSAMPRLGTHNEEAVRVTVRR
jgi:hypothetical protein